jgi:hypothetical protein
VRRRVKAFLDRQEHRPLCSLAEAVSLDCEITGAVALPGQTDARKGRVVELRYFGGLSVEETAEVLGISPETAKRDWPRPGYSTR